MNIRPATNEDISRIRTIVRAILLEYDLHPDPNGVDADLSDIERNYFELGGFFDLVLDGAGEIVGTVGLYDIGDRVCELRRMYLLKKVRGRGWGRQLLGRVIERARALGFRRIELETADVLVEAIHLYERYGFRPISRARMTACCHRAFALNL